MTLNMLSFLFQKNKNYILTLNYSGRTMDNALLWSGRHFCAFFYGNELLLEIAAFIRTFEAYIDGYKIYRTG